MDNVKRPPKERPAPSYLVKEQVDALLEHAPGPNARLCMLIMWRAGLRVSEVIGLRGPDITLSDDHPTIRVRGAKGGKFRYVPIHPELDAALRYRPNMRSRQKLFKVSRQAVNLWMARAYEKAVDAKQLPEGKEVHPHVLRHSFARHCLANGIAINEVQLWLGHSHLNSTLIYLRLLPDPSNKMAEVE